jgi:cytochrome c6
MRRFVPFLVVVVLLSLSAPLLAADAATNFKTKCAVCHGADGSGDTAMGKKMGVKALGSAEVQKQSDAALNEVITKGKAKMPAYDGKMTPDEIKALVGHIRSLAKK